MQQLMNKKLKRFIRKATSSSSAKPQELSSADILSKPSYRIYNSIHKLPLHLFIDCSVDGTYESLTIEGEPSQEVLLSAWIDIQSQISDVSGDSEQKYYIYILKEVNALAAKYNLIQNIIAVMRIFYWPSLGDELNLLVDACFGFDYSNTEEYHKKLDACFLRSETNRLLLQKKSLELKKIESGFQDGNKPSRDYYVSVLNAMSNQFHYEVTDSITVASYYDKLKKLNAYYKSLKRR